MSTRNDFLDSHIEIHAGGMPPAKARRYAVLCDDCKRELRETDSLPESAAGGLCDPCRAESQRKGSRAMEACS